MIEFIEESIQRRKFVTPIYSNWGNIGKGKMAVSAKSGNPYPIETPHYNFTLKAGFEDLGRTIVELYGSEPMSLDFVIEPMMTEESLPLIPNTTQKDYVAMYMPNYMQAWAKSQYGDKRTMMIECTSKDVVRVFNPQTKRHDYATPEQPLTAVCGFDPKTNKCNKGCVPTARLFVILPALCKEVGAIGYFTMTIHGKDDLKGMIPKLRVAGKSIGSFVWRFNRVKKMTIFPDEKDGGKLKEKEHYPIEIKALIPFNGVGSLLPQLQAPTAPALPPSTMPQSGGYGDDNPLDYEDMIIDELTKTIPPLPYPKELPPKPTTQGNEQFPTKGLAMAIIRSLREHHRAHSEGVGITDILHTLVVKDLETLGKAWEAQYPTLTQDEFSKVVADDFVAMLK